MLVLESQIKDTSVMSLQTGSQIGKIDQPVIDPANLAIIAYSVNGPLLEDTAFMRLADVRELSDIGFIVDSIDELVKPGEIIKLDELIELSFSLKNRKVLDEKGRKIGKVIDYTIDAESFYVQQLTVKKPLLSSFSDPERVVNRSQITEINDTAIIVKSQEDIKETTKEEIKPNREYVNPFRKTSTARDN